MIYKNGSDRIRDLKNIFTKDSPYAIAVITSITNGVFVRFWGENNASSKSYKRLSSYTPVVGDKVLLAQVGGTFVILGKII